jgi:hypothetical protein
MTKRLSITPKPGLLSVTPRWRAKFAQEACEILINEGRMTEVLLKISGLSLEDLTGQPKTSTSRSSGRKQANKCRSVPAFEEHETLCKDVKEMVTDGFSHGNKTELTVVNTTDLGTDLGGDSDQNTLF